MSHLRQIILGWLLLHSVGVLATAQTGHVLDAIGPVNQSMGGAGTGLPLDAIGAIHHNPASICGLRYSEVSFGFMGFASDTQLSSEIDANAFGPNFPATNLAGSTKSDSDISPIPSIALVHKRPDSPWAIGLGGVAIGGFGVDLPATSANPILSPQPAQGGWGFGGIYSQFQLMQFSPTVARSFANGWSVGFAPTFNWALLSVAPFSLANPNLDGSYPSGAHADAAWGIGFQIGAYFQSCASPWSFGFSYKSPQWFDDFKINSVDNLGQYRQVTGKLDYPSIIALGMGYHGFTRTKLAVDVRYIDYENTDGFEPARFAADGSVTGFGWSSIWVVATGVEFALTESWRWRFGYTFNQLPIDHSTMFYSSPSPALTQHHLSTGFSVDTPGGWTCHMAYHYGFKNSVSGNWWHPSLGQVPGTRVTGSLATHGLLGGVSRRF